MTEGCDIFTSRMSRVHFTARWSRSWSRRPLALLLSLSLAAPLVGYSAPSWASDDEAVLMEARAKFQRALELEHAGNWAGAVKLFREVGQVKMTPQVRYHIATCEENLGQLVTALGGYELALSLSEEMPPELVTEVEGAIAGLRARIPKLLIERGLGAEAANIVLDEVALGTSQIGVEIPLDPGPHVVVATAPGYLKFSRTVTVAERESQRVVVELEREPEPLPPPPSKGEVSPPGYGPLPYILGGVGLVGLGAGAVLLPMSLDRVGQVQDICGGNDCRGLTSSADWRRAQGLASDAQTFETIGWIAAGVGVAGLATGLVLFFIDPERSRESEPTEAGVSFVPSAPGGEAGFSFFGRF